MSKVKEVPCEDLYQLLATNRDCVPLPNNLWAMLVTSGNTIIYTRYQNDDTFLNLVIYPDLKVKINHGGRIIKWIKCGPLKSPKDVLEIIDLLDKISDS